MSAYTNKRTDTQQNMQHMRSTYCPHATEVGSMRNGDVRALYDLNDAQGHRSLFKDLDLARLMIKVASLPAVSADAPKPKREDFALDVREAGKCGFRIPKGIVATLSEVATPEPSLARAAGAAGFFGGKAAPGTAGTKQPAPAAVKTGNK